jgi:hypothetical protein
VLLIKLLCVYSLTDRLFLLRTGLNPIWHEKFQLKFFNPEMASISLLVKTSCTDPSNRCSGHQQQDTLVRGLCYAIVPLPVMQRGPYYCYINQGSHLFRI